VLAAEIDMLSGVTGDLLASDRGCQVVQQLPGIGPVLAAVIVVGVGEVTRFRSTERLCSRAGLTPPHGEPGLKAARGHVSKQGSRALRWALAEAIQPLPEDSVIGAAKEAVIARRGKQARNIAKAAATRKLLTLACHSMRDGQIRALARPARLLSGSRVTRMPATGREPARHSAPSQARGREPSRRPAARRARHPSDWPRLTAH